MPTDEGRHTGLRCLVLVAAFHRIDTSIDALRHEHVLGETEPSDRQLAAIARHLGIKAKVTKTTWQGVLGLAPVFPLLARLTNGAMVVVNGLQEVDGDIRAAVYDPLTSPPGVLLVSQKQFEEVWSGSVVLLRRRYDMADEDRPFGLGWFAPLLLRHRELLRDVMLAAVAIQVVGLASPLYFRVVLDRVLVHHSEATLLVLTVGALAALAFEAAFTYLRQYVLLHATNKIDIRLATRIFAHLLSLPMPYFETVAAGVTVRHMQQAEKIRNFLTGRLLTVMLEAVTLLIYLPLLIYFSGKLTLVVLAFGAVVALVVASLVGPFRSRLRRLYNAEAARQAMLVETVAGMRTVKSLTLEPVQRQSWEAKSATAVERHNDVGVISAAGAALTGFFEKTMSVVVIAMGATDVFSGTLSVGALIAFQMLAGRVIAPFVQAATLVQEYQDTALSVRMLAEIMNRLPERRSGHGGGLRPVVQGQIEFDRVTFRYAAGNTPALDRVGLRIAPGRVVGVVGRSGSGKSTIAKLLQGLYALQDGVIRVDSVDIREYDLGHLRRQVCVVPQDAFIFRGTVRDNIALSLPTAPMADVVTAARVAGADEFIERLPHGYETELEEGGQNLSGGQKQRLSIARALLLQPPILVLDEATSALDPDSEAVFLDNLAGIASGRTTLIISHRLNTLVSCDALLILENGRIVDAGRHSELLERCTVYQHLWKRQNRHL